MFKIKLEFSENLWQQRHMALTWVHDELKGQHLGLNHTGECLPGNLFFTDWSGGEHAIVVGPTGEKEVAIILGDGS